MDREMQEILRLAQARTRGQAMVSYLIIALAVIGATLALKSTIDARIGTAGQPGSLIRAVQSQYEHPSSSIDGILH